GSTRSYCPETPGPGRATCSPEIPCTFPRGISGWATAAGRTRRTSTTWSTRRTPRSRGWRARCARTWTTCSSSRAPANGGGLRRLVGDHDAPQPLGRLSSDVPVGRRVPLGIHHDARAHEVVAPGGDAVGRGLGRDRRRDHDLLRAQDRKSTRLNSSHVEISYAV